MVTVHVSKRLFATWYYNDAAAIAHLVISKCILTIRRHSLQRGNYDLPVADERRRHRVDVRSIYANPRRQSRSTSWRSAAGRKRRLRTPDLVTTSDIVWSEVPVVVISEKCVNESKIYNNNLRTGTRTGMF